MLHEDLTKRIISAFYNAYNILGNSFLEKADGSSTKGNNQ